MNISIQEALEIAKEYNISGDSVEISYKIYTYPKSSLGYKKGKRKLIYWQTEKSVMAVDLFKLTQKMETYLLLENITMYFNAC